MADMKVRYVVHSAHRQVVAQDVKLPDGRVVEAQVPNGFVMELVAEDGKTTTTIRCIPEDIDATLAAFEEGSVVEATFTPAPKEA